MHKSICNRFEVHVQHNEVIILLEIITQEYNISFNKTSRECVCVDPDLRHELVILSVQLVGHLGLLLDPALQQLLIVLLHFPVLLLQTGVRQL